ncbi:MAG: hypothetical protein RM347_020390 [Nostoc sp. ChiQUE02]|uniref:hypothetical protein n=1 Tax=Nostoc sp. ChiQUE02 TaxID=3075377 RepID=UPI002AD29359|nr:hypothetical protein [Nostoc sp. ChiQUE02]MDZ8229878.1 hypothetical protein [Nostoc sp. ChiQUE02]
MRPRKRWKKCLSVVTVSLIGIGLAIGLHLALGGSVYHPLTHLYKIGSWLGCKNSTAYSCNKTPSPLYPVKTALLLPRNTMLPKSGYKFSNKAAMQSMPQSLLDMR